MYEHEEQGRKQLYYCLVLDYAEGGTMESLALGETRYLRIVARSICSLTFPGI